jgi:H+/gluconate symporter-like permease
VTPLADGDNNVADANDADANDAVANDGNADNGLTSIDDEAVPQAPGEDTNAWALVNLIAAILTVLTSLILLLTWFIGKKKEEDEEDEYAEAEEDEDESKLKRRTLVRLGSLIPAIVSVIAFIVTEDMRNPMIFVDRWTLLMIVILIIELLFVLFSKKKNVDDDEDDDLEYVAE